MGIEQYSRFGLLFSPVVAHRQGGISDIYRRHGFRKVVLILVYYTVHSPASPSSLRVLINGPQRASVTAPQNSQSGKCGPCNGTAGASTQRKLMSTLRPVSKSQPRVPASSAQQPTKKKPHSGIRREDLPNGSQHCFREDLTPLTSSPPSKTLDMLLTLLMLCNSVMNVAFTDIAKYISFLVPSVSDIHGDKETVKCYPFMRQEAKIIMDEDDVSNTWKRRAHSRLVSHALALYLEIRKIIPQAWRQSVHSAIEKRQAY
ncbi:hypothetical protein DEU56DRAFT_978673 [Suillus clintonianus]|uniref:uncharacterized protein n=1 Tax=Suillus clintonianus TaxID=1904413 RepID=UPI001B85DF59|nr:uncharacterized protein DEU56DRAFT_978673 [Suillus clintonianus]KAG2146822.1 hypothetical protein DEU56DRAFT_978673 [Suillus clintonianus]